MKKNQYLLVLKEKNMTVTNLVMSAIRNGALLSITNKKKHNSKTIFQKDPLKFFNKISSIFRKSFNTNTISITGSSGKTSVKELTGFCLNKFRKNIFFKKIF